ncbi:MAG: acyl-CoA dehydrogenase [Acidimicrobiaceae bacterium]|nr:acyl-CoA dehydrogenase [Acidimicrobiaceae bacterium]
MELLTMPRADDVVASARRIGEEVAGRCAEVVDRDSRFPSETVAGLRSSGLLGALVPHELGGPEASLQEMSQAVSALAQYCASSALVLAMHQIQVATLMRHATNEARVALAPRLLSGELLLASANSEVGLGGERRSSLCALEPTEGGFRLDKQASTVSYGEFADGVVATARRGPESRANDQVLAVCLPPSLELDPTGEWDTLGLRGTRSRPCHLVAEVPPEMVVSDYADAFMRTSLPTSAVLLSSVWWGLAEAAGQRAHSSVRSKARKERMSGAEPSLRGAFRLAELGVLLHQMREVLAGGAAAYDRSKDSPEVATFQFSSRMDNVKLSSSTLVLDIAQRAMGICGLGGYENGSQTSMGRIMRDAAAAPLMVNNDRALEATAQALLVMKEL